MQKVVEEKLEKKGEYSDLIDDIISQQDFSNNGRLIDALMEDLEKFPRKYSDSELSTIRYIISLYLNK